MTKLKCWKKPGYQTSPPSILVYEKMTGNEFKIRWVQTSNIQPFRVGGVDKRGRIQDKHFKTKSQAIKYLKSYIKSHDKC